MCIGTKHYSHFEFTGDPCCENGSAFKSLRNHFFFLHQTVPYFFVDNSLLSVSCSVLFCFVLFFLFISITYHVLKCPKRQTVSFPNSTTHHPKSKTGKKIITLTHGKRLRNHVALIDKSEISCGSSSLKDLTPTTDRSC